MDKADFAAGASSKSSRMIHGGLRYLENREFRLVSESLLERNRLLDNAAHYVAPLKTTIPLFSWCGGLLRSALIFAGLSVGREAAERCRSSWACGFTISSRARTAGRRTHFITSQSANRCAKLPALHPGIVATATYWDAWITQSERLCIELLQDARQANPRCRALNYVRPEGLKDGAVLLKDSAGGSNCSAVRPRIVVNATGAWVDITNGILGLQTRYMGGTKGSHLVVDCRNCTERWPAAWSITSTTTGACASSSRSWTRSSWARPTSALTIPTPPTATMKKSSTCSRPCAEFFRA